MKTARVVSKTIVFDMKRTFIDGKVEELFTDNKVKADNFLFNSVFEPQIELSYKKFYMPNSELLKRLKK